jgi:hypothetical protein
MCKGAPAPARPPAHTAHPGGPHLHIRVCAHIHMQANVAEESQLHLLTPFPPFATGHVRALFVFIHNTLKVHGVVCPRNLFISIYSVHSYSPHRLPSPLHLVLVLDVLLLLHTGAQAHHLGALVQPSVENDLPWTPVSVCSTAPIP